MKHIILLGATGSIGTSVLEVISFDKQKFNLLGVSANENYKKLAKIANTYKPKYVCLTNEKHLLSFKKLLNYEPVIFFERQGLLDISSIRCDLLVNAIVGFAGLEPTICAIKAKSNIALANKETMVAAGEIVNKLLDDNNVSLLPVDSEHNAIFQCLNGNTDRQINKIILTASGGPFLNIPINEFNKITVSQALSHPTWGMGKKISIDSATMANKALEIIEAINLFKVKADLIDAIIHPQSIIHGMLEFKDASILALLGPTTMELPIRHVLHYPENINTAKVKYLDFSEHNFFNFVKIDIPRYPIMGLIKNITDKMGILPCVFNAANEVAVENFLIGKLSFIKIYDVIYKTISNINNIKNFDIRDIISIDKEIRIKVQNLINGG